MKVALVGLGHIARHQLEAIRRLKGQIALAGVYDRDPRAPARFGLTCTIHKSLDELIAQSDADVVVVSTPNRDHFATTSRLLKAGRAVMVEKPVCDGQEDLRKLIALAKSRKLFLHAALHAAFARDLNWWTKNRDRLARRFGPLTHFHMGFYDPYIGADGALEASARGLGGSWDDSGINALSVLAAIADPASLKVTAAGMFSTPGIDCLQVNGWARLTAEVEGRACHGQINTDWMLGLNRKTTLLSYPGATILLDHSNQQVVIADKKSRPKTRSLRNGTSRLTNQYVGVFRDLAASFRAGKDNSALSAKLHALLFAAARRG
jgi:D-galactose 1-dehydrogenase